MFRKMAREMVRKPKENTGLRLLSATEEFNPEYLAEYARDISIYNHKNRQNYLRKIKKNRICYLSD